MDRDIQRLLTEERLTSFLEAVDENRILRHRESSSVEFKEEFNWADKSSLSKIAKITASFANNRGGVIVFGVKKRPNQIVVIDRYNEIDDAEITTWFNNHFSPTISYERGEYRIQGKQLGLLLVHESDRKPVAVKTLRKR